MSKGLKKKLLAATMSVSMVASMGLPALAAETDAGTATGSMPIYSYDITDVVVPTVFTMALNPNGLKVKKHETDADTAAVTDQVVSLNYGIANKSNTDKLVKVKLTVDGKNDGKLEFTDASGVTNSDPDAYALNLNLVSNDDTSGVKVDVNGTATVINDSISEEYVSPDSLADVTITGATGADVNLQEGESWVGFVLEKAEYTQDAIVLGSTDNVGNFAFSKFDADKGAAGFTFAGTAQASADWSEITEAIDVSAVYTAQTINADSTVDTEEVYKPVSGTGALYDKGTLPEFTAGPNSVKGVIGYTNLGSKDNELDSIVSITMELDGVAYDGYNAGDAWAAATMDTTKKTITLASDFVAFWTAAGVSPVDAKITYVTKGGETKTTTVSVKVK